MNGEIFQERHRNYPKVWSWFRWAGLVLAVVGLVLLWRNADAWGLTGPASVRCLLLAAGVVLAAHGLFDVVYPYELSAAKMPTVNMALAVLLGLVQLAASAVLLWLALRVDILGLVDRIL